MENILALTPCPNSDDSYKLVMPFKALDFEIPADFVTDGASIPKMCWKLIGHPFHPKIIEAGVVHDYLYRTGGKVGKGYSRHDADKIFKQILFDNGFDGLKIAIMFRVLRWFGSVNFQDQ